MTLSFRPRSCPRPGGLSSMSGVRLQPRENLAIASVASCHRPSRRTTENRDSPDLIQPQRLEHRLAARRVFRIKGAVVPTMWRQVAIKQPLPARLQVRSPGLGKGPLILIRNRLPQPRFPGFVFLPGRREIVLTVDCVPNPTGELEHRVPTDLQLEPYLDLSGRCVVPQATQVRLCTVCPPGQATAVAWDPPPHLSLEPQVGGWDVPSVLLAARVNVEHSLHLELFPNGQRLDCPETHGRRQYKRSQRPVFPESVHRVHGYGSRSGDRREVAGRGLSDRQAADEEGHREPSAAGVH
jgi:hypothetical protein